MYFFLLSCFIAKSVVALIADDLYLLNHFVYPALSLGPPGATDFSCTSNSYVRCNQVGITELSFPGQALAGELTPLLYNFTELRLINLSNNLLTGEFFSYFDPIWIEVDVSDNEGLEGDLHASHIGSTGLRLLNLANTAVQGGNFVMTVSDSLRTLILDNVNVEAQVSSLGALVTFSCVNCSKVMGELSVPWPPSLEVLRLSNTEVGGLLPEAFPDQLRILMIDNCSFYGTVPTQTLTFELLQIFRIELNQFSGPTPDLSEATMLGDCRLVNWQEENEENCFDNCTSEAGIACVPSSQFNPCKEPFFSQCHGLTFAPTQSPTSFLLTSTTTTTNETTSSSLPIATMSPTSSIVATIDSSEQGAIDSSSTPIIIIIVVVMLMMLVLFSIVFYVLMARRRRRRRRRPMSSAVSLSHRRSEQDHRRSMRISGRSSYVHAFPTSLHDVNNATTIAHNEYGHLPSYPTPASSSTSTMLEKRVYDLAPEI